MSDISVADVYTQNQPVLIIPKSSTNPEITFDGKSIRRNICGIGHQLLGLNIKAGDVVSLALPNSHEIVFSFLAIQSVGATANPLNPAYTTDEYVFYLEDTKCKLFIVPEGTAADSPALVAATRTNTPVAFIETAFLAGGITTRLTVGGNGSAACLPGVPSKSVGLILHTSGTTSRPKAVPLTLGNLLSSCRNIIGTYNISKEDRGVIVMPLFHVHGLMCALLAPLLAGSTVIIQAPKFSPASLLPLLTRYKVTWFTAVPTMHQLLLRKVADLPDKEDYLKLVKQNLRFLRSCSSALSPATYHQLVSTWGVPVYEAYAMTEASHQMTSNPIHLQKPGSVGIAHGGVTVVILDEKGNVMAPNAEGEICVKGENVTSGYLNNPTANESTFVNGFLRTGDTGFMDQDGFVWIKGRNKEQINRGGEKIMPGEIDNALLLHPAVAEAVAYGAPDALLGQAVHAAVTLKPDVKQSSNLVKEIQTFMAQHLAKFKIPAVIHVTNAIPKTATGKIQRRLVAEHFAQPQAKL